MKIFTETKRLILREIMPEDEDAMYELDSDPEVHRYLGNKPVQDKRMITDIINSVRQQYQDHGIGRWAVVEKTSNDFIGWAGLKFNTGVMNNHIDYYDMGYRLIRRYWQKGYATESALASLAYGFGVMQLDTIYAAAHVDNIASNRIIKKAGFKYINAFSFDGELCNWYEMSKPEWLQRSELLSKK